MKRGQKIHRQTRIVHSLDGHIPSHLLAFGLIERISTQPQRNLRRSNQQTNRTSPNALAS